MKKHLSKRLLSLFLAVMMVVTAAPFAAFGASNAIGDEINYLFAYFTGNDDENVRLAVSEDGYNFEALNGNDAILRNDPSTIYNVNENISGIAPSGHARDPYILPQADGNGYYIIATDLNAIDNGYRNSKLLVWKIDDLSEAANVQPWAVETAGWFSNWNYAVENSSNGFPDFYAWAPEAIWVESRNQYMMYWSAGTANDGSSIYNSLRIHYAYTSDFRTFYNSAGQEINAAEGVEPEVLYNPGYSSIDGDITYYNGTYYLWYKNEDNKTVHYATATNSNGPYIYQGQFSNSDYSTGLEGPFVYQLADGTFVLMMDLYNASVGTFLAFAASSPTTEFNNNSIANAVTINYLTPRHGNVCQISTDDYDTLVNTFGKVTFSGRNLVNGESVNDDTLIARYFINDDLSSDATGHNYTLTTSNVTPGVDGNRTYAHFTDNGGDSRNPGSSSYAQTSIARMMDDYNVNAQDGVTVSFYARSTSTSNERFFELSSFSQPGYVNSSNQSEGSYVFYNN